MMASISRLMVWLYMGSPPAPHLANGWLSQFENLIKEDAKIYDRCMDDVEQKLTGCTRI